MSVDSFKKSYSGFCSASLNNDYVNSPQECEDLRKENKYLSNEIHMERIMMRTENELVMRNLRNLNQELQAQIKEVNKNTEHSLQQSITQEIRQKASTELRTSKKRAQVFMKCQTTKVKMDLN